jgi:hypothetical protein
MWFICPICIKNTKSDKETLLKVQKERESYVCNLREQKNHFFALTWQENKTNASRLSFHLVGKTLRMFIPKKKKAIF